jgi:hypothetical protein
VPALTAPQQVGVRQDLSDLFYLADVKETPFTSMVKKGSAPTDMMLWEYGVKSRGNRKRGGVPDGKDVDAFDAQNPKTFLQARSEVWRRAPMVGFLAQIRSQKGGIAGTKNEFNDAVADQMEELKRDKETELLSNQDSSRDDGVNGSQTRALGRWVYNGTNTLVVNTAGGDASPTTGYAELPVPNGFRTPTSQIYSGVLGDGFSTGLTEDVFKALIASKWTNTGASSELRGFVTSVIKDRVGVWSRYQATVSNATPNIMVTSGKLDGTTLLGPMVDVYKSDYGTFTLHPVSSDFMPTIWTGYFLDMKQVQLRVTEGLVEKELPDLGGGPREYLRSIIGLEAGDPRAHCKIDCSGA